MMCNHTSDSHESDPPRKDGKRPFLGGAETTDNGPTAGPTRVTPNQRTEGRLLPLLMPCRLKLASSATAGCRPDASGCSEPSRAERKAAGGQRCSELVRRPREVLRPPESWHLNAPENSMFTPLKQD